MHLCDTGETHVQDLPQAMEVLIVIALIDQGGVGAVSSHQSNAVNMCDSPALVSSNLCLN